MLARLFDIKSVRVFAIIQNGYTIAFVNQQPLCCLPNNRSAVNCPVFAIQFIEKPF
jgi:hypothetical protein